MSRGNRFAWLSVALLFVLLLCHQWWGPDIWYHLYLGERVAKTLSAQPPDHLILQQAGYVNFYWLFQLLVRGVFALGGLVGVSALFMAWWAGALGCWMRTSGARQAGVWAPALALVAVLICQNRFEQRPEIVSYVFLALQIHWLTRWGSGDVSRRWEYGRFALVQAAWVNVHGYFVFGPALVGARLVGEIVRPAADKISGVPGGPILRRSAKPGTMADADGPALPSWSLWALLGVVLAASFVSPFGWRDWQEVALQGDFLRQMRFFVQEFLPPTRVPVRVLGITVFEWAWLALAVGWVWVAVRAPRKQAFALLLAAAGLGLSAYAMRNLPLLLFLGAPLLGVLLPRLARIRVPERAMGCAVGGLALGLGAWVVTGGFYRSTGGVPGFGLRASEYAYPVRFTEYLRASGFDGRLFNDPSDGGYLEYHLPELRLYGDTRFVEARPIRRYFSATADPVVLRQLQKEQAFDGVLVRVSDSPYVVTAWLEDRTWRLAYADLHRAFFIKRRSDAGARAAEREPQFYRGEDLTVPVNGGSAANWVGCLTQAEDRIDLLRALRQFAEAPQIPAELIEFALQYGKGRGDAAVTGWAMAMRPRMITANAKAVAAVDGMLRVP